VDDPRNFDDVVRKSLNNVEEKLFWFYVAYVLREKNDELGERGDFTCAVNVQAPSWIKAGDVADQVLKKANPDYIRLFKLHDCKQIPDDRIPVDEYCNTTLTLFDVPKVWPEAFKGKKESE
jgi:hypothetical protein